MPQKASPITFPFPLLHLLYPYFVKLCWTDVVWLMEWDFIRVSNIKDTLLLLLFFPLFPVAFMNFSCSLISLFLLCTKMKLKKKNPNLKMKKGWNTGIVAWVALICFAHVFLYVGLCNACDTLNWEEVVRRTHFCLMICEFLFVGRTFFMHR